MEEENELKRDIRICNKHDKQVPLIWTFAFNGAEYWCPYCGANYGMMGAGKMVKWTPELATSLEKYEEKSSEFLHANGVQVCVKTMWEDEKIDPKDLPQAEKDRLQKIIDEWKYEAEND